MTGNSTTRKLTAGVAVVMAALMMLSVFAMPVAAINQAGTPDDVPGGESDVDQQLASTNIDVSEDVAGSKQAAITIDISALEEAGVDTSNVEVASSGTAAGSGSVDYTNVDGNQVQVVATDNTGTLVINDLKLTGIDTTGVDAAQDLTYTMRVDADNSGDFGSNFQTAAISDTGAFNVASIVVENLDTDETVTETNLGDALAEADGDDTLTVADGETTEVRLGNGTFSTDVHTLDGANPVRIVATEGAEPTIQSTGAPPADPLIEVTDADSALTVDGVTFDLNNNAVTALQVTGQASDLTVIDSTFDNSDGSEYIEIDDAAGTVEITGSTFLDPDDDNPTHILASDDGGNAENADLTLDNNEFNDTAVAVDLSNSPEDFNSLTVQNNAFNNNNKHVDGDNSGTPDLDSIFADNTFDQYAVTEESSGAITSDTNYAVYGDLGEVDPGNVDTAQTTTIVSAGDHDLTGTTLDVGSSEVSLVAADGTTAENVTVTIDQAAVDVTAGISDLTISGITFDGDASTITTTGNTINGLTITDNRFIGLASTAIDATVGTLNSVDISGNFFAPAADGGSDYQAVNINDIADPGDGDDVDATISDNNITATDGTGITVSGLTDGNDNNNNVLLTISNNEIELTGTAGNGGIITAGLDVANDDEVVDITSNTITAADGVGATTGIDVDTGGDTTVNLLDNSITNLADPGSVGLNIVDFGANNGLTVENNDFDRNGAHIDFDSGSVDAATLDSNNDFATFVFDTTNKDETFEDQEGDVIYGTIGGGLDNAAAGGDYIQVRPGTYEESGVATGTANNANLVATGSASETVITTSDEATILNINSANEVDGFTFASTTDSANTDVTITDGGAELSNSTFSGPGTEDRTAIAVSNDDADPEVINVTVSNYAVGITVDSTDANTVGIQDSTVSSSDVGIELQGALDNAGVELVRNTITDNTVGVDAADPTGGTIVANFNDITDNEDAGLQFADVSDLDTALANWWGDEAGPNVSEDTGADVVVDATGDINDEQTRPWLTDSVDTLSQDGLVLVTDPTNPSADGDTANLGDGALWLVATLDDDEAGNVNADDITLTTQEGPDSLQNINRFSDADDTPGEVSAADPIKISSNTGGGGVNDFTQSILPASATAGDYTVGAFDTADNAESGSAVQTFTAPVAGVDVTSNTEELVADDDTEATITLQLVDDAGNPVARSGVNTEFAISNSGAAGTSRVSAEGTTDVDGQAELVVTADTAGETFSVTGIDTDSDNSDTVSVSTVEAAATNFTLGLVEGPTTITQNESYSATLEVTNEGDAAGTQTIEYTLDDSAGLSSGIEASEEVSLDAGNSTEVTFEVPASATADLETGNYTHVFASDDDELTVDAEVVEEGADETALARFDSGDDGTIDRDEAVSAIVAFNTGGTVGGEPVTRDQAVNVIVAYNTGVSV